MKSEGNTKGIQILCISVYKKLMPFPGVQRVGFRVLYSMRIGPSGPWVPGTQFESVRFKNKKRLLDNKGAVPPSSGKLETAKRRLSNLGFRV